MHSIWQDRRCKGCDRIAEGVRLTDECHARIEKLLEDERLAKAAESKPEPKPASIDISPARPLQRKSDQPCCALDHGPIVKPLAPLVTVPKTKDWYDNDYWDFDDEKKAWRRMHVSPENGCILRLVEIALLRSKK